MDRQRWQKISEILDQVLELTHDERDAFVHEACAGDDALRIEVERLLLADDLAEGLLDAPILEVAAPLVDSETATAAASSTPFSEEQIGPYQIVGRLGDGAMGEVFQAFDTRLQRKVAIKILPSRYGDDAAAKERFLREARAASKLDHPHICPVFDIGESNSGHLYIVMAHYSGQSLQERIEAGPLSVGTARTTAIQLALGLERAHQEGIIHRDIKPANVVFSDEGEAKILDFGIAQVAGEAKITLTGRSPGTPAYMSPEQMRGDPLDQRTDIWSLGVVLYYMVSGTLPFSGSNVFVVLHAILNQPPHPLRQARPGIPEDLYRIIDKALAKETSARYQTIREMREDLESIERPRPDDPSSFPDTTFQPQRPLLTPIIAGLVIALLLATGWFFGERPTQPQLPATGVVSNLGQTSLAVLYFQNLNGDQQLDWLREGIPTMLVTDLAQSPGLDILSTNQLYQELKKMDAIQAPPSLELMRKLAEQTSVEVMIQGSYARLGERYRIILTLQDATTGSILLSKRVEGTGDQSLFSMVDELSGTIRDHFEVGPSTDPTQSIQAVTTASLEAWRYYTAGLELLHRSQEPQAIAMFEEAIQLDPQFALALVNLGRSHQNLRDDTQAREYMRRALESAQRLPVDERLALESAYYGTYWSTDHRATDALEATVARRPEKIYLHHNLANRYFYWERYNEALNEYDVAIQLGTNFGPTFVSAALAHSALDQFEPGHQLLVRHLEQRPEDWFAWGGLALFLSQWNRFEEADVALTRAFELQTSDSYLHWIQWRLAVLRRDESTAQLATQRLLAMDDGWERWRGAVSRSRSWLYQGRSQDALEQLRLAVDAFPDPTAYSALAHCWMAEILLARHEPEAALAKAQRAMDEGQDDWPELLGMFMATLALEELGRPEDAEDQLEALRQRQRTDNQVEARLALHLKGLLALSRGQTDKALQQLHRASSLLPPRGVEFHSHTLPDHVPIWFALGQAEIAADNPEGAIQWFRRVAEAGAEHIEFPIHFVRSSYFLAQLSQEQGLAEEATSHWQRFLDAWAQGDLDREQIREGESLMNRD